ncbi:TPA: HNH endonuclease [Vibrio cholerae]
MNNKTALRIKFNCENCGKERIQKHSEFKRSKNHYCSRECSFSAMSARKKPIFTREFTEEEPITATELKELFSYDEISGDFTVIKKYNTLYKVGDTPLSVNKDGYLQLRINKKMYVQHRLAWLYMTGFFPDGDIDHINHDRLDNRFCNLRVVTKDENNRNMSMRHSNTSGVTGVSLHRATGSWCAEIKHKGKKVYLGLYKDINDAKLAREEAEVRYGYHENHGK